MGVGRGGGERLERRGEREVIGDEGWRVCFHSYGGELARWAGGSLRPRGGGGGFAFKTITRNALGMDGSIRLTPSGPTTTKIDYHVEILTRGLLRVLEPLLRSEMARNEAGEMDRLKARLEAPSAEPAPA